MPTTIDDFKKALRAFAGEVDLAFRFGRNLVIAIMYHEIVPALNRWDTKFNDAKRAVGRQDLDAEIAAHAVRSAVESVTADVADARETAAEAYAVEHSSYTYSVLHAAIVLQLAHHKLLAEITPASSKPETIDDRQPDLFPGI